MAILGGRMVTSVSVMGLGKLGSPLAACFAARGFQVHAVDVDPKKVDAINGGLPPVHEPGLAELIAESKGRLRASSDAEVSVRESEATFIVVGTPSEASGGFSLRYALPTCEAIGQALKAKKGYHLVVMTSTVMPGSTGGEVKSALERASGKRCGEDFGLCYSPEFIALGSVIRDFYYPDFLLIGEGDARAGDTLAEIYSRVCKNTPAVARMNFVNAEITKLAVNTYVTTKISFANMLARICERTAEADVNVVTGALGLDSRIGAKYLKGAVSYGGPCFPRDNRAMAALAAQAGAVADLAEATDRFNRAQVKLLAELVKGHHTGRGRIGILGLTYKPNTDVVEESFGLLLAQELAAARLSVAVYDPAAGGKLKEMRGGTAAMEVAETAEECIRESDVVVIATPWEQFREIAAETWTRQSAPRTVIDCWRLLGHLDGASGVQYVRLGFGGGAEKTAGASRKAGWSAGSGVASGVSSAAG
jgi:UDPglucose 6-dehydrogenase